MFSAASDYLLRLVRTAGYSMASESRIGREEVKDKFKAKIDQLREHLRGKLYDPHLVGGHALEGGDMFSSLLEEVCAAINHCDKDLVPVR